MSMPKRPRQHQVEDLSINALKHLLPREWVYREKDKDYGIDGEIEIFDTNNCATGIVFLVQLKATDSDDFSKQKRVQLSHEVINYYRALELSVLIVRYIEKTKQLYIRWSYEIDTYGAKKGTKTFSFMMNENELWIDETPTVLYEKLLKIKNYKQMNSLLPIKVYFDFSFTNYLNYNKYTLKSKLRTYLDDKPNIIDIVQDKKDSICNISLTQDTLSSEILGIQGFFLHSIDKIEYKNIEELIGDIFIVLSVSLLHFKKGFNAIEIIESLVEESDAIKNIQIAIWIIQQYIKIGNAEKAFEIWQNIPIENKDELENLQFQLLLMHTNNTKTYEQYLKLIIELNLQKNNKESLGITYYNYGNLLRTSGSPFKAFKYYKKALKYNPHYYKEDYIFKELGGALFEMRRYSIASKCYKHGLDIKSDNNSIALYADSLMMEGKYELAKDYFQKHIENTCSADYEWILKKILLDYIIKTYKIESQTRSYYKATNSESLKNIGKFNDYEHDLHEVIKIDALFPSVWFDFGNIFAKNENYEDAMYSFLICSIVNKNDSEAWFNSFVSAWNSNKLNFIEPIIYLGYKFSKEEFIDLIYSFISNMSNFPDKKIIDNLYAFIEDTINKVNKKEENKPVTRLFDGKKFQDIREEARKT